jgi:hypothetical protein
LASSYYIVVSAIDGILNPPLPDQLYHYTSFGGLLGIAKSRSIWASNIHYLNDEQEFAFGLMVVRDVIRDYPTTSGDDLTILDHLLETLDTIERTIVFVASFSEVDDLLSQWRGYCPNGKGVSIGLLSEDLSLAAKVQHFRLVRVAYDRDVAEMVATELVEKALRMRRDDETIEPPAVAEFFAFQLSLIAPALKHESFSEEREWRIVSPLIPSQRSQLAVREIAGRLVPYFDFKLADRKRLRFGHVRVGPASDRTRALAGTTETLDIYDVDCDEVLPSRIPYRE